MDKLKPCRDNFGRFKTKHGMYGTRLYHIWNGFTGRCFNPKNKDYENYGGRGITVCEDWKNPTSFFDWAISNGYSDTFTLDRKDTNGPYSPENCRWITSAQQQRNRRNNHKISYNGEEHCLAEWAEITGMPSKTILSRIRRGWDIADALFNPAHVKKRRASGA